MRLHKVYLSVIILLLIIILAGTYKFIFQGAVSNSEDQRTIIHLTDPERHIVLSEMRQFLMSVQKIAIGIRDNDMSAISEAARRSGNSTQQSVPGTLVAKLPMGFKKLGFDTHSRFDQIALDAESFEDREHSLSQLSEILNNCVACHETYQFKLEDKK